MNLSFKTPWIQVLWNIIRHMKKKTPTIFYLWKNKMTKIKPGNVTIVQDQRCHITYYCSNIMNVCVDLEAYCCFGKEPSIDRSGCKPSVLPERVPTASRWDYVEEINVFVLSLFLCSGSMLTGTAWQKNKAWYGRQPAAAWMICGLTQVVHEGGRGWSNGKTVDHELQ